jgi:two-component system LytT family response regulator
MTASVISGSVRRLGAIIVDDERLARESLRTLLAAHPEVDLLGEADSVASAAALIARVEPDLVFLDIQMTGETGFELFGRVPQQFRTIFVTAFDEFAIRAFEVNALDYLLKPVTPVRLAAAIGRAVASGGEAPAVARRLELDDHLFVTSDRWSGFVRVGDIVCIQANAQYSEIVVSGGRRTLVLKSMKEWEERLPDRSFVRIHRSTIVNVACVERLERSFNLGFDVYVRHLKEPLIASRRYAARLKECFG